MPLPTPWETARKMWADVEGATPIVAVTNGVREDLAGCGLGRALAATSGMPCGAASAAQASAARRDPRPGWCSPRDTLLIGFARRAATYGAYPADRDREWLKAFEQDGLTGLCWKAHRDQLVRPSSRSCQTAKQYPSSLIFTNYDMHLGAAHRTDVWLNNPIRPKEAGGTSGMKATVAACST